MSRENVVLVLIDGIGDVSVPALGHRTPLQAASTPFMDAIAGASGDWLSHSSRTCVTGVHVCCGSLGSVSIGHYCVTMFAGKHAKYNKYMQRRV